MPKPSLSDVAKKYIQRWRKDKDRQYVLDQLGGYSVKPELGWAEVAAVATEMMLMFDKDERKEFADELMTLAQCL